MQGVGGEPHYLYNQLVGPQHQLDPFGGDLPLVYSARSFRSAVQFGRLSFHLTAAPATSETDVADKGYGLSLSPSRTPGEGKSWKLLNE